MLEGCRISGFADEIHSRLEVQLAVMKELGQEYLELRGADGIGVADMTMEQAKGFRECIKSAGIRVSALGSPIGKIGITEDFEPHFALFRHVVELAGLFETKYIRMFSFYMPAGEEPATYRNEVMDRVGRMVDYAKEHQVVLLHENEKEIYGDNAMRCEELMKAFYGEHFQCTFDFANFVQCGQDTLEAYDMLKPYISYVHVKDALADSGEVVLAGDGAGHVKEILTLLEERGYKGFLSLEPHLTNFVGSEKLEREETVRREQQGSDAYRCAYRRLQEIL